MIDFKTLLSTLFIMTATVESYNLLSQCDTGNELLEALEYICLDEAQAWDDLDVDTSTR